MSLDCLWTVSGLSLDCPCTVSGLSLDCLWFVSGLSLYCLWTVSGLSLDCLWIDSLNHTKVVTNQILISKYSKSENSAVEKLQEAGIIDEINRKRIELTARRLRSACLTTHLAKVSMELIVGCFYSQNRLAKISGYGQPKPCQTFKYLSLTHLKQIPYITI